MIYRYTSGGGSGYHDWWIDKSLSSHQGNWKGEPNAEKESTYSCGGREAGGMTISFHPKRRASSEKAPGPRRAMAAAMPIIGASASFDSKGLNDCRGNQENAIPRLSRHARRLRIGVRK